MEHRQPIERDDVVAVAGEVTAAGERRLWVFDPTVDKRVYATARVSRGLGVSRG